MRFKHWLSLGLITSTCAWADLPKTGGNYPTITVEQRCEGYSLEEAKRSCFNSAIEQVVGQVIISDLEVSGDRITRDNIGQYSAGYINDYVIQKQHQDEHGWWQLKMSITVASSKIAQRKIMRGERVDVIDGAKAQDLIESQLEQRANGDELISMVLASYPENAYVINSGQTEFKISNLRQLYIDIPYSITMSQPWLAAFNEALDVVAVNVSTCSNIKSKVAAGVGQTRAGSGVRRIADSVCGKEPDIQVTAKNGFFADTHGYYFADIGTLHTINSGLRSQGQQHVGLRVDLLNAGNGIIDSRCARINNELFIQYSRPRGTYNLRDMYTDSRPTVVGQNNIYGTLRVHINNTQQLEDLAKIKLNIQQTCI